MAIDLHNHTYFSFDAEGAPEAGLDRAKSLGLRAISFTEHHDLSSLERGRAHAERIGLEYVGGVELSGMDPVTGEAIDVLGYFLPGDRSGVLAYSREISEIDTRGLREIVRSFPQAGLPPLRWEDYVGWLRREYPDAPHRPVDRYSMHAYLVREGRATDRAQARTLLNRAKEFAKDRLESYPSIEGAVTALRLARALIVVAHPMKYALRDRSPEVVAAGWKALGVHGLEALYGRDGALRERWLQVARGLGLCVSSGSDCHHVCAPNSTVGFLQCPYTFLEEMRSVHERIG